MLRVRNLVRQPVSATHPAGPQLVRRGAEAGIFVAFQPAHPGTNLVILHMCRFGIRNLEQQGDDKQSRAPIRHQLCVEVPQQNALVRRCPQMSSDVHGIVNYGPRTVREKGELRSSESIE